MTISPLHPLRWKLGLGLLAGCLLLLLAGWFWLAPDRTWQVFWLCLMVPLTGIVLLVWWLGLSGVSGRCKLQGLGIVGLLGLTGVLLLRIDGYTGDMLPIFAFRWSPRPQQRAAEFWAHVPTPAVELDDRPPMVRIPEPEDWAGFRGAQRDGVQQQMHLRQDWKDRPPRLLWKQPVGAGWSSFAVISDLAVTQEQRGEEEAVVCYERDTGREFWVHTDRAHFTRALAGEGPRATPTIAGGRVFTLGATGILNCLSLEDGSKHWSRNILEDNQATSPEWGMVGSPLVVDEMVIVNAGGLDGNGLVAYDCQTGERHWSGGNHQASYASPQLAELHGQRQVLVFDTVGLAGHSLQDGTPLWHFAWSNLPQINVAQPMVVGDDRVLISSGYRQGAAMLQIDRKGDDWSCQSIWTSTELKLKFNPGVVHAGFVYGLDEGILVCLDIATGKRRWKRGRFRYGQMLRVDDLLLIQSEEGEIVLVEASPEGYREVGRFQAIEGKTWNCPVVCRQRLLVRNAEEAACYDLE